MIAADNRRSPLTVETALYAGCLLLALALRLYHLGAQPLNAVEAREALIALSRLRAAAGAAAAPASPAFFSFAFLSFFLFGASDATARLAPALAGGALVLAPALFRDRLGRGAALTVSGLLAFSPTLIAASRAADGTLLALLGLMLGLGGLWRYTRAGGQGWLLLGAAGLGLSLASGGPFLPGLLALGLTLLVLRLTQPEALSAARAELGPLRSAWLTVALAAGATALLVAALGSLYLRGVGALADSWLAWLRGFTSSAAGQAPQLAPLWLIAYEPLLLVFGVAGAVRAFRHGNRLLQGLAWFSLIAFALLVIYPGRQLAGLVWVAAPLAALGGWMLFEAVAGLWLRKEWPLVATQVGISLVLVTFAGLNLATYAELARGGRQALPVFQMQVFGRTLTVPSLAQLGVGLLAVALVLIIAYLFAMGWSERSGLLGLTLTGCLALAAITLSAGWGAAQEYAGDPAELWWRQPASADVRRLVRTLSDVSNYAVGNTTDIDVTVEAPADGILGWTLRDYPHAAFVDRLDPLMNSSVVITPSGDQNPTLGSAYVGQDFTLSARWNAPSSLADWVNWLVYRRAGAVEPEPVILWVRQDVQKLTSSGE